jgi:UDP-N-acetylglucosamine transferase subunit ALG13
VELVVVSVGTDVHPFDRLIDWSARWAAEHPEHKVVIQRGTSAVPLGVESHALIPHDELRVLFRSSTAVVSHGGPSTLMDARLAGRLPIVVPRDPSLGEHIDDHQLRFAEHMHRHGLARRAITESEFRAALGEALNHPTEVPAPAERTMPTGVRRFGEMIDGLLGITTELRLCELDDASRP